MRRQSESLYPAHDAGITNLTLARDNENNTWELRIGEWSTDEDTRNKISPPVNFAVHWPKIRRVFMMLLTGGFDKTVKIWSQDGQIMHKFDGFSSVVSGLCYVPPTKTIWIAAGSSDIPMYDPKSGDNVSEFMGTFQSRDEDKERVFFVNLLFIPDLNQVIGTDSRRQITIWKHHPTGCVTALKHKHAVECLTYTKKVPILIFSGDSAGQITKWERLQSNTFMYSKENLPRSEAVSQLASQIAEKYDWVATDKRQIKAQLLHKKTGGMKGENVNHNYNTTDQANVAAMKLLFVEELDLVLVASEDHNIFELVPSTLLLDMLHYEHPYVERRCVKYSTVFDDYMHRPNLIRMVYHTMWIEPYSILRSVFP